MKIHQLIGWQVCLRLLNKKKNSGVLDFIINEKQKQKDPQLLKSSGLRQSHIVFN